MTLKPMIFLTHGAMAIAGITTSLIIAAHPAMAQAQAPTPTIGSTEQLSQVLEELNLTPEQQTQMNQIRDNTRSQLEVLLTPEQREQFRASFQSGNGFQEAIAAINLSPEQQTQLRSLLQSTRQEVFSVLTEEQQQQVRELIRSRLEQRR